MKNKEKRNPPCSQNSVIGFIGNFGIKNGILGGQILKCRAWEEALIALGHSINKVNLSGWKRHPLKTLLSIRHCYKKSDSILLITGSNGWKRIIPILNFLNRQNHKKIIYATVGLGMLNNPKLNSTEKMKLLSQGICTHNLTQRDILQLSKLTSIVVENNTLNSLFKHCYGLKNVATITNFRFQSKVPFFKYSFDLSEPLALCYFSRIDPQKGIFNLIRVLKKVNETSPRATLDIFGGGEEEQISKLKKEIFGSKLIHYHGEVSLLDAAGKLQRSDFLIFPTLYPEGVPGVVIESFQLGLPIIASHFLCADELIQDSETGLLYEWGNDSALASTIERAEKLKAQGKLQLMHQAAKRASLEFEFNTVSPKIESLF